MALWNFFNKNEQLEDKPSPVSRNPNYKTFASVNNDIERIVASKSIILNQVQLNTPQPNPIWLTLGIDSSMLLMPVASNKLERLNQYRSIAKYTECRWCLDEIADEFIHEDINGNFITMKLPNNKSNLNETRRKILQEQFTNFMELFRFKECGYNLIKRFLVEGELAWENVIDPDQPYLGIKGVKFLLPEYYETLVDTKTNTPAGLLFDTEKLSQDIHQILSTTYLGAASIFNTFASTIGTFTINTDTCVPMLWSQLTYINSGDYSHDGLICYPMIEDCRQAYHQLALLQEAAVILRVTRAPERYLFNVSTAGMNHNYADEYVREFANSLKAKKTARPDGDIGQVYNPMTMLESWVFGKSTGNDGTTVETVTSTADYEQMGDIEYFLRRFFKQFKVPFSRYKTPENSVPPLDQLSYEEHSFLRMIIRLQRRFALGFKKGFITHLKLRGIWDKYELIDSDLDIQFVKPAMYDLLELQQVIQTKMEIYKMALGDNDEFSKSVAMKKYLGMSDEEIKENYMGLIRDKEMGEQADFIGGKVSEKGGLVGYDSPIPFNNEAKSEVDTNAEKVEGEEESSNDEGGENGESENNSDENSGNEESSNDEGGENKSKENSEPSFGLS